jgi:hypothetical protein
MRVTVSRGLLATEAHSARALSPGEPCEVAARVYSRLCDAPAYDYAWKERAEWAARLYRGAGDERGRRLYSEAGRTDARYVARVARRALRGQLPGSKAEWGHLRESIRRIFSELGGGE